ncbi:hypothetical protein OE766_05385 [Pararhizobium sp. YC-54]|uniref:hypothetical protein n=1 Tax=Pararhizobium sp. YC-54 TaxID=2986920 RepID=UPI0021F77353|nr:hypothetical protein [Pararhizobium sp. YC-54]MCV9997672.1 hypothetical protein [Pararhizobium sp. YC-54]
MQLNEALAFIDDSERGATLELRHPVSGAPTGMKLVVAGPDSRTQRAARLATADELSDLARADGTVSAEDRERATIAGLARCILCWEIIEDGEALPLTHSAACRLLSVSWAREQVDAFAGNRANFVGGQK